ncbi:MAG: SPOR domain-containing protein [Campylobacterales bacterium]|nr:SPOR domain-containing protein [Campylobacterales bacterium]
MRKFLLLVMMTAALFSQQRYTIQVISADNEASITKAFIAKIKQLSAPYVHKKIEGKQKIFVGNFHNYETARAYLYEVRSKVSQGAFVVKEKELLAKNPEREQIAVSAETKMLQPPLEEKVPEKAAKAKEEKGAIEEEVFCRPTKKALREAEISAALSFYKSSSFYTFK